MSLARQGQTPSITIIDVANEAKVSKSTVSLVLQGSPLIREETAERVRRASAKLGYVYNRRAAELRSKTTNIIGVVITDLMNPLFAEVFVGIERRLVDAGYTVLMAHTNESIERQTAVIHSMREQNVAGLLLCPVLSTPASLVQDINAMGLPYVVMIRSLGKGPYDFVGTDNKLGFYQATLHLLNAGHTRIAFIGGTVGVVFTQRLQGYKKALAERGIAFDPALLVRCIPTREGGYESARKILELIPRPSAAVCYNDIAAFGALWALGERGLRAGVDFSVTGSDNVVDAAHSNPPLSTIDVRPGELGEQAASALLTRIREPQHPRQSHISVPKLLIRQSG